MSEDKFAPISEGHRLLHQVVFHEHHGNKELSDEAQKNLSQYIIALEKRGRQRWDMETGDFHETDGWYFKRLPDGAVRVRVNGYGEHTMPPNSWASVVAHVSKWSETADSYQSALTFHGESDAR